MKIKSAIIGGLALAFSMGSAHATQFVKNGDFTELTSGLGQLGYDTAATHWATTGYNYVFTQADKSVYGSYGALSLWDQANGGASTWDGLTKSGTGNFVAMDGDFETGALTQTIYGLHVGRTYTFSFNYAFSQQYGFGQSVTEDLSASLGSSSVTLPNAFTNCDGNGNNCTGGYLNAEHGFSGWSTYSTTITATSTSEVLSFLAGGSKQVPPFALISDVSVTGVPELSTWALMLMGFAGLGFAGHRRAKNRAVA